MDHKADLTFGWAFLKLFHPWLMDIACTQLVCSYILNFLALLLFLSLSVQPYIGTALPQNFISFIFWVKKDEEICNLSVTSSGTLHLGYPVDYIILI